MMWYWGSGYGWGMQVFGAVMMLVFWGGFAALIVVLVRAVGRGRPTPADGAFETLRRRLAAGEITTEEYERIRKVLQG